MRKSYLDNIRWVTVVLVVFFHVLYMYNSEGIPGTLGKITSLEVQYYDVYMYIVFPWFMAILFIVSGISAKLYLDRHTDKEFIGSRTTKLLVPCTIGLVAFQFIQGYINMSFGDAGSMDIPAVIKYLIMLASGIGVLWYIQVLWLFSMVLILIRKIEKNRLLNTGKKTNLPALILLSLAFYGAGQILNTPIICVYRFGLYFTAFIMGYFVFSHDEVIDILKKMVWALLPCSYSAWCGVLYKILWPELCG
ncbi:acyltransferase family protein [Butyrivibrio sp. AE3003]|uniref:acyltransferase family protein n=1 Tax=Butyrivibrio sp. AE3003 TaxID=1496721 RepID=UPI0009DDC2A8|nr:acyltransferase family protein [Butyrivibrio sp. AE3003]